MLPLHPVGGTLGEAYPVVAAAAVDHDAAEGVVWLFCWTGGSCVRRSGRGHHLQVGHQPHPQRVFQVHTLGCHQVPGYFGGAFPESDGVVVHCKSVWVIIIAMADAFRVQHFEVVHGHLQYFGLLELCATGLF